MKHQQAVQDIQSKKENNSLEFHIAKDGIFYTLQGEGKNVGYPTIFIRLHGSNINYGREELRHTWDKSHSKYNSFRTVTEDNLLKLALDYVEDSAQANNIKNICFTGGEAMLQQKAIIAFIEHNLNYRYEIETNGLIYPDDELIKRISTRHIKININPIFSNDYILSKEKITKFSNLWNVEFKLECQDITQILNYIELFDAPIARDQLYILPKGDSEEEYKKNRNKLFNQCIEYGLALSPRMQLDINSEKQIYER